MKGSTVDREILTPKDLVDFNGNSNKFKNRVLKDGDFKNLEVEINIKFEDCQKVISIVEDDTKFLKKHSITDYSLFLNVHLNTVENSNYLDENNRNTHRILKSIDGKYIYCFSIIDFLTV
jgi:hypothetical protein